MVNLNPYDPTANVVDPYALLEGGKRSIKFVSKDPNGFDQHAPIGTSFTGIICDELKSGQITDFETKQPAFYQNGDPKMQVIIKLQTEMREEADDDGIRSLYVKGQMLAAFQQAVQQNKHLGRPGIGTRVTVTLIEYKNTGKGNPQKIYAIQLGPEYGAYVPQAQQQVNQAIGYSQPPQGYPQQVQAAQAAGFPPQAQMPQAPQINYQPQVQAPQYAPPAPQPVAPAQPQYNAGPPPLTGQVYPPVPQAAPLPQAVQPQGVAAVPQPEVSPALAALNALAAPAAPAPVAPAADPRVTPEVLAAYHQVVTQGVDQQTAVSAIAQQVAGGDPSFVDALLAAVAAPTA